MFISRLQKIAQQQQQQQQQAAQQASSSSSSQQQQQQKNNIIRIDEGDHDDDQADDDIYGYSKHKSSTGRGYTWEKQFKIDLLDRDASSEEEKLAQLQQLRLQEERRKRARISQNKNYLLQNTIHYLAQKSTVTTTATSTSTPTGEVISSTTTSAADIVDLSVQQQAPVSIIRKGIIRYLYLVVDMSNGIMQPMEHGSRTARLEIVHETCAEYVKEYFDQNPLSQMGLIATRNSIADKCSELSGSVNQLLRALKEQFLFMDPSDKSLESMQQMEKQRSKKMGGEASLQNALKLGMASLSQIPSYGSKEILIVYSSLSTCDPGDIFQTIKELKDNNIRCSVVSLDAEMHILKCIAKETNGNISVPLNTENFKECLFDFASPPPVTTKQTRSTTASLIRMGFPQKKSESYFSVCACHQEVRPGGYICPKCKSKYCELPTECKVCGLTLVSSPHLARSYHHLFPVKPFIELNEQSAQTMQIPKLRELTTQKQLACFSCMKHLPKESTLRLLCLQCQKVFCIECDSYIHNDVHNCPGCDISG